MQKIKRRKVQKYAFDNRDKPCTRVKSGEVFQIETDDALSGMISDDSDKPTVQGFAGEHFARSSIGQKYGIKDLDWFLNQWVYQTALPNYQLDYKVESREGGGFMLRGTLSQENVPEQWFMPIPLEIEFNGGRIARTSIAVTGSKRAIELRLPEKPQKVRLDPDRWILTDKTGEKGN